MFVLLVTVTASRDLSIFVKINTFGVVFTIMICLFICYFGVLAMLNRKIVWEYADYGWLGYIDEESTNRLILFNSNYHCLFGILCGGFYLHNISLPIYRNAKNPENNVRDVFLGFLLVFLSYAICGVLGYMGFANQQLFPGGIA